MVDFAERNGLQDSDGTTGNDVNRNLVGYHLDANGVRQVTVGSSGLDGARGIEATAFVLAPTFFSHVLGLEGWPLKAAAKMYLDRVYDRESNCRARTNPSFRLPGLEE